MRIVDTNVLLYAVNSGSVQHAPAKRWLDDALAGEEALALSWLVLAAFLRLATNRAVFPRALTIDEAASLVEAWLARPSAVVVHPTPRHLSILRGLLSSIGTAGNLVNDAHLAALALEHGAEVVSFDRDFGRFPGLRFTVPGSS